MGYWKRFITADDRKAMEKERRKWMRGLKGQPLIQQKNFLLRELAKKQRVDRKKAKQSKLYGLLTSTT